MNHSELIKRLDSTSSLAKGSKALRILKRPRKLLFSKIIELTALFFRKSFKLNAKTFWGDNMVVIIPEIVSSSIYRYGFFEEGLTRMILEYLKPNMVFFDIGAHYGYFTLLASFIVGDNGQVHAFEPTPSTFDILKLNTEGKNNVILNNLAVSSKKGKVLINDYGIRYSAWNSLHNPRLPEYIKSRLKGKKYEISAISIDEYVQEHKVKPNFIKIDAESHEYEILLGMEETIEKYHPIITIEVGDFDIEGVPRSKELVEFLINKGYQPYEYRGGKIVAHRLKDKYSYDNILFLPK